MIYLNYIFNLLFTPFRETDPVWPILILSLIAGILIMSVFKITLNSNKVKRAKNRLIAHLLEIPLYKDNIRILLSAQKNMLFYNLKYLLSILKPVIIVIIPMSICIFQISKWFSYEPLNAGDNAILTIKLDDNNALNKINIEAGDGLNIDTPALRMPEDNEISWRISADKPGRHFIKIDTGEHLLYKNIIVSDKKIVKLTPKIVLIPFLYKFLYPGNKSLTSDSHIRQIEVDYKARTIDFLGMEMHWLVLFTIFTIVFGLTFRKLMGVRI